MSELQQPPDKPHPLQIGEKQHHRLTALCIPVHRRFQQRKADIPSTLPNVAKSTCKAASEEDPTKDTVNILVDSATRNNAFFLSWPPQQR